MAEYHYKYDPSQGSQNQNGGDDLLSWIVIVIALAVFWPLGLFLLFRKLMSASTTSGRSNRRQTTRPSQTGSTYHYTYTYNPNQAKQAKQARSVAQPAPAAPAPAPAPAVTAGPAQPAVRKLAGGGFIAGGSVMTGLFGCFLLISLADAIGTGAALADSLGGLLAMACFTGIGLVLLYVGLFRRKRSKLFRKYQALIGRRDSVNISTLVNATGRSYKKVCDELQDMLDFGVLPMGYLDLANDKLVLTSQGITDQPQAEAQATEEKTDDDTILAQIKMVNDAIPDPVMSAKIDRIGTLTGKILDYQRKNPDKDSQLRSFLNYYLPTTLKILRAYAQLDQQGIEGENISAAKARIEGMMDKVVEGFEKQLDKLFRDEALDITSDVSVLEKMLDKDGLGQGGGLRLEM